jgi:hypothetical protein
MDASTLFRVDNLVAVVTGGGTGESADKTSGKREKENSLPP